MAIDTPPILEVRGLKKSFGEKTVLHGIDLSVSRGDVISILGPNGCGKSTFLRCLNLLELYQEGEVRLQGEIVSRGQPKENDRAVLDGQDVRKLRSRVGMVFQRFNLFPHMSVLKNVMSGPRMVLGKTEAESRQIAEVMLRKVGLWEKHPCAPGTLSGGQQQRVAIARALAVNPEVMLFDEATSALDPVMTQEVLKVVKEVSDEGMTMLLVTHDMDFARDAADRAIFMEHGRIAVQGTPEEVFDRCEHETLRKFLRRENGRK